jgi:hypothetical protein
MRKFGWKAETLCGGLKSTHDAKLRQLSLNRVEIIYRNKSQICGFIIAVSLSLEMNAFT